MTAQSEVVYEVFSQEFRNQTFSKEYAFDLISRKWLHNLW